MDYLQVARDLIGIDSTTGREEPVAAYLSEVLERDLGLAVRGLPVAEDRRNLLAGPEGARVLFCTHMDTVPPYVPLREDDEFIRGRGACDTKGIIACQLEAGRRLLDAGVTDFGYLFLVGEEVDNIGARVANESVRCGYLIVGEPTENRLAVGHKGVLGARVSVAGRAAHSAYPENGDSAVHRLLRGLDRLLSSDLGRDPTLGPATVNVGVIRGGVAGNVLAPDAEALVVIRVVDSPEDARRRLDACFRSSGGDPDPSVTIEETVRMDVPRLERLEGYPETVVAYGTDVPFLEDVGRPLLFGPGSILDAHTDGEKIAKREMRRAVDAYVDMVRRLVGA